MRKFALSYLILFTLIVYSSVSFSATLNVEGGVLMGATGVNVNGSLYDVSFLDGTCAGLYNGCDQNTDFPFTNPLNPTDNTLVVAANAALLEQVFIDSPLGAFDSSPDLTNGCTAPGVCRVFTPLWINPTSGLKGFFVVYNFAPGKGADTDNAQGGGILDNDTTAVTDFTRAVWTQSSVVPIPAAVWLFGSGLIGLVGFARRKKS